MALMNHSSAAWWQIRSLNWTLKPENLLGTLGVLTGRAGYCTPAASLWSLVLVWPGQPGLRRSPALFILPLRARDSDSVDLAQPLLAPQCQRPYRHTVTRDCSAHGHRGTGTLRTEVRDEAARSTARPGRCRRSDVVPAPPAAAVRRGPHARRGRSLVAVAARPRPRRPMPV